MVSKQGVKERNVFKAFLSILKNKDFPIINFLGQMNLLSTL
jgi:hypothetical protein